MSVDAPQRKEYRKLRVVELLRNQLSRLTDVNQIQDLIEKIAKEEADLRRLQHERAETEKQASNGGVLAKVGPPQGSLMDGTPKPALEATVHCRMARVPTAIIHLLEGATEPLVTFRLKRVGTEPVRLRVTSYVENYSAKAVDTIELTDDLEHSVDQLPTFFPDRLRTLRELTRATLHIEIVVLNGDVQQERSFPIWLLARTSMQYGLEDPTTGEWKDLSHFYAAWVTPNAPEVMKLVGEAARSVPTGTMQGYLSDAAGVKQQVGAIYDAVRTRNIVYLHSAFCFGAARGQYMHRLRLPRESLAQRSADCIDGTVLLASALEAASINPGIVLVPGHAFLAWETGDNTGEWEYLETTRMADLDFNTANLVGNTAAQQYQLQARTEPTLFRCHSVTQLRTERGIYPME